MDAEVRQSAAYPGPGYNGYSEAGLTVSTPTYSMAQSKTWWHDGAWWALLYDSKDSALHVAELGGDHIWRLDPQAAVREH